jgi:hypothetical protein
MKERWHRWQNQNAVLFVVFETPMVCALSVLGLGRSVVRYVKVQVQYITEVTELTHHM